MSQPQSQIEVLVRSPAGGTLLGLVIGIFTCSLADGIRLPWGMILSWYAWIILLMVIGAFLQLIYLAFHPERR